MANPYTERKQEYQILKAKRNNNLFKMQLSKSSKLILLATFLILLTSCVTLAFESLGFEQIWLKLLILVLGYGLPITLLFQHFNKHPIFSVQKKGALFLILLAMPIFSYALVGVQVPMVTYPKNMSADLILFDGTPLSFDMTFRFSARGSFSAENPIHVKVTIWNCSVPDLTKYFYEVGFTNAFYAYDDPFANRVVAITAATTIHANKDGTYTLEDDLIWHAQTIVRIHFNPPHMGFYVADKIYEQQQTVIEITSVSDTLSFRSSQTMEQLTYAVIGFSVIMLQPIVNVLYPDPENRGKHS